MGTDVSQSGRLLDITFNDEVWTNLACGIDDDGLSNTGFTLSETTPTSGIFTGTFQIPEEYCTTNAATELVPETTTGKDLEVNYVDYSDASGELIEVGDSLVSVQTLVRSPLTAVYTLYHSILIANIHTTNYW